MSYVKLAAVWIGLFVTACLMAASGGPRPVASEDGIDVYFSPDGGCTEANCGRLEVDADGRPVEHGSAVAARDSGGWTTPRQALFFNLR